jgi:hypothetical protein
MLKTIGADQGQEFEDAVRAVLPILCFTPDEVDAFIGEYAPQSDGRSHVVEDVRGRLTFCRYLVDGAEVFVDFVIPSVWEDRYALVKGAILQLRDEYLTPGSKRYLRMHVDETVPSHVRSSLLYFCTSMIQYQGTYG